MRHVLDTIESFGLSPDRMMIEITESTAARRGLATRRSSPSSTSAACASRSTTSARATRSLDRLHRMAVTTLKIDRSFVAGVPADHSACVSSRRCSRLADGLGLQALAEGIETEAQRAFLLEHGCPLGQGFLFSPPVAAAADRAARAPAPARRLALRLKQPCLMPMFQGRGPGFTGCGARSALRGWPQGATTRGGCR